MSILPAEIVARIRRKEKEPQPRPRAPETPSGSEAQQAYYKMLANRMPEPFNTFPWNTSGFMRFVRESDADPERIVIPDAWCLIEDRHVYVLEIVESHDIDEDKAQRISDLAWSLHEECLQLHVVLFYPVHQSLFEVYPYALTGFAEKLKGRKFPFRDAFKTLMVKFPQNPFSVTTA